MKTDDFEKRLQRQTLREIPAGWRAEILAAARVPERKIAAEVSVPAWRLIFARFPVAWGALAAVWIALVSVNLILFGHASPSAARREAVVAAEPFSIRQLQSAELEQIAGGEPRFSAEAPANAPSPASRSPRSDLRREENFGEFHPPQPANPVV